MPSMDGIRICSQCDTNWQRSSFCWICGEEGVLLWAAKPRDRSMHVMLNGYTEHAIAVSQSS